jgi:Fic family protein
MHQALDNLEKFIQALSGIPQLVRAGLIHYQFDAIRPFRDRNGHMGSLLAISMLSEGGLI